eukprot:3526924-Alexandrium_andersonii.AAC.1
MLNPWHASKRLAPQRPQRKTTARAPRTLPKAAQPEAARPATNRKAMAPRRAQRKCVAPTPNV